MDTVILERHWWDEINNVWYRAYMDEAHTCVEHIEHENTCAYRPQYMNIIIANHSLSSSNPTSNHVTPTVTNNGSHSPCMWPHFIPWNRSRRTSSHFLSFFFFNMCQLLLSYLIRLIKLLQRSMKSINIYVLFTTHNRQSTINGFDTSTCHQSNHHLQG